MTRIVIGGPPIVGGPPIIGGPPIMRSIALLGDPPIILGWGPQYYWGALEKRVAEGRAFGYRGGQTQCLAVLCVAWDGFCVWLDLMLAFVCVAARYAPVLCDVVPSRSVLAGH